MIKLNLGCGDKILEGYENYDLYSNFHFRRNYLLLRNSFSQYFYSH